MFKYTTAALAAALAGCGGGGGSGGAAPLLLLPAIDCSVALYGDSILHGMAEGATRIAEAPAAAIKRLRPAFTVTDRTAPGLTATGLANSFASERLTARIVVLQPGTNDAGQGLSVEQPYQSLIRIAHDAQRSVVVTGLSRISEPTPAWVESAAAIERIATGAGAIYANWPAVEAELADGLHPTQAGSHALVDSLVRALDLAAPECAP